MDLAIQDKVNNILWKACDTFRGVVDAADYKNYVLTMLFVKYLSDLHREHSQNKSWSLMRFILPNDCSFEAILEFRKEEFFGLGARINYVLQCLEEKNPKQLGGVFQGIDFDSEARLGQAPERQARLEHLVDDFKVLDLRPSIVGGQDVIGNAYEFLIARFAAGAGKKAGEFYTPFGVSKLIAALVEPKPGETICDPTCGSGSLLIHCGLFVRDHMGEKCRLYGQEVMGTTWTLARMNMLLHGMEDAEILRGDTLRNPQFTLGSNRLKTFDLVVANPPFSLDKWGHKEAAEDPYRRFERGLPPKARADYAFLSHMIETMAPETGRAGVVAPNGVLFRGGAEKRIRKALVDENLLDAVIGLPANMFYGTGIPAAILIFRRKKRDRSVLFLDAGNYCTPGKKQNTFSPQQVMQITEIYKNRSDRDGESILIPLDLIRDNDYNLNIPRYLDKDPEIEPVPDEDIMALNRSLDSLDTELARCRRELNQYLRDMGYDL